MGELGAPPAKLEPMVDQHKERRLALRMPQDTREQVWDVLKDAGWGPQEFWLAVVGMLLKRPKTFLAELERFRPGERRGRPKKTIE